MNGAVFLADGDVGRGELLHVRCSGGFVTEMGAELRPSPLEEVLQCAGGRVLHGLHDHHLHLLSAAARSTSFDFADVPAAESAAQLSRLAEFAATSPRADTIRCVGFDEAVGGWIDRPMLDAALPGRSVRIQHRSGHAWLASTAALARLGDGGGRRIELGGPSDLPVGWVVDDDVQWSLDDGPPPDLCTIAAKLTAYGVTSVTDATPHLSARALAALEAARASGDLRQNVEVMCHSDVLPRHLRRGPLKIMLPGNTERCVEILARDFKKARARGLAVAVHCVTVEQLLLTLEMLEACGSVVGDRIEHASLVPLEVIARLARLNVTVVTQPNFVSERGDHYLDEPTIDRNDLYRLRSLRSAGIRLRAGSDAPFGSLDPWSAMRSAVRRTTQSGRPVGRQEALEVQSALHLFGRPDRRSSGSCHPDRALAVGDRADFCVLRRSWPVPVDELDNSLVAATVIDGRLIHQPQPAR